jgi:hypothetical protein
MERRSGFIVVLCAVLGGSSTLAACTAPFIPGTGGVTTTSTTTDSQGGSTASSTASVSASSSSGIIGGACDLAHPGACGNGAYCLVANCNASAAGMCVRPQGDAQAYAPVCGCDRLDYWNGAVAADQKVAVRVADQCPIGIACTPGSTSCQVGRVQGYCNITEQDPSLCSVTPPPGGTCWVLPASCMNTPGTGIGCIGHTCKTQCDHIHDEEPYTPTVCTPS